MLHYVKKRRVFLKKKSIWIMVFLLIILFLFLFFRYGGKILVAKDESEHVEDAVIVLLMGSTGDRALGAAELYKEGKAEQIMLVHSYITGAEALEERGITIPGDADISQDVLIELGVPEEDIILLPGDAESTKDEALVIRKYAQEHPELENILLVTSEFHSYRAELIFNKALDDTDVTVYSAPTPYDPYEAEGWYRNREDIQRVITEYLKLAHYFFLEQFQMT